MRHQRIFRASSRVNEKNRKCGSEESESGVRRSCRFCEMIRSQKKKQCHTCILNTCIGQTSLEKGLFGMCHSRVVPFFHKRSVLPAIDWDRGGRTLKGRSGRLTLFSTIPLFLWFKSQNQKKFFFASFVHHLEEKAFASSRCRRTLLFHTIHIFFHLYSTEF